MYRALIRLNEKEIAKYEKIDNKNDYFSFTVIT